MTKEEMLYKFLRINYDIAKEITNSEIPEELAVRMAELSMPIMIKYGALEDIEKNYNEALTESGREKLYLLCKMQDEISQALMKL